MRNLRLIVLGLIFVLMIILASILPAEIFSKSTSSTNQKIDPLNQKAPNNTVKNTTKIIPKKPQEKTQSILSKLINSIFSTNQTINNQSINNQTNFTTPLINQTNQTTDNQTNQTNTPSDNQTNQENDSINPFTTKPLEDSSFTNPIKDSKFDVEQTVHFSFTFYDYNLNSNATINFYIDRMNDGLNKAKIMSIQTKPGIINGEVKMTSTLSNTDGIQISLHDSGETYNLVAVIDDFINPQLEIRHPFSLNEEEIIADETAIKNKLWEHTLLSQSTYQNPYKDVTTKVTFTKDTQSFSTYAFWDGQDTFKIRTAFPSTGLWEWKTTSSNTNDLGLHNKQGTVQVNSYSGTNPLYKHGFLKISQNKRYLVYDDNTPFFWLGDTAWIAPLQASYEDWKYYIDDRASKKFNIIQISPASDWGDWEGEIDDVYGNVAFFSDDKWNPAFWQEYDRKIKYANDKGLIVAIVGIMEPTYRYPKTSDAVLFARNIASRYAGNFVILSPSFDTWNLDYISHANSVGEELDKTTSRHLITQHPGTPSGKQTNTIAEKYYGQSYMDFTGMQTGHNSGDLNKCVWQAINWDLAAYEKTPTSPVINMEAFYDSGNTNPPGGDAYQGTALDSRSLGYLSILSGAKGYTYGAYGLWNWKTDQTKGYYWKDAMKYSSSSQMTHLYNFFNSMNWYDLIPSLNTIKNQPTDNSKLMAFSKTSSGDKGVAYLHKTNSITLDMTVFSSPVRAKWYNPLSGSSQTLSETFPNTEEKTFTIPSSQDWVLYLYAE